MFCAFCGGSVTPNSTICPECGRELNASSRVLNPRPRKVLEVDEDFAKQDIVIEENEAFTATLEETPVADNTANKDSSKPYTGPNTVQLDYREKIKVSPDVAIQNNVNTSANKPEEFESGPVVMQKNNVPKRSVAPFILIFIVLACVGIVVFIFRDKLFNKQQPQIEVSTAGTTEDVNMEANAATDSDATVTDAIQSAEQLDLQSDTLVVNKNITISDKEYTADSVEHYSDSINSVDITECKYVLSQKEAQLYMDEQEVKYQLGDASLIDVKYLGGVFRYHYSDSYQYGMYKEDILYVYEINDSLGSSSCDNLALEYFNGLEVETDEK